MTTSVSLDQWKQLYDLAAQVKALAPWEWMDEAQIFGLREPQSGELGFVSVMGQLGEYLAVAVYLGADGLAGFQTMQNQGMSMEPPSMELVLETPQLQLSFEDRAALQNEDRRIIKQLGLKFRGSSAWPLFRSYRPGLFPWFIEPEEARFLAVSLEQLLVVAPRLRENPDILFDSQASRTGHGLIRERQLQAGEWTWTDTYQPYPQPQPKAITLRHNTADLKKLETARRAKNVIQADLFMLPAAVRDQGGRPYYAYMLMIVEAQSGKILRGEPMKPLPSLEEMWGRIPALFSATLANLNVLPEKIAVRSELLMNLLESFADTFQIRLERTERLKALDRAKDNLLSWERWQR